MPTNLFKPKATITTSNQCREEHAKKGIHGGHVEPLLKSVHASPRGGPLEADGRLRSCGIAKL